MKSGKDYGELRPVYSIWLLEESLFVDTDYARNFQLRDSNGHRLLAHGGIWVLELGKFVLGKIETEQERWLGFFVGGENLDDEALPPWMDTQEMRQAMGTLRRFSEKEREYHEYQARQNYLRQQRTLQVERKEIEQALQAAVQREEAAVQREEAAVQREEAAVQREEAAVQEKIAAVQREAEALQEIERLKALLNGK